MSNGLLYFLMTLAMISWGESWVSAKLLTGIASAEVLVFWRFFLSWITFIPVLFLMRKPIRINFKGFLTALATSILLVFYNEMFFTGLVNGLAGAGGILLTTLVPILTFALGCVVYMKLPSRKDFFGLFLGLVGASIILEIWHIDMHKLFASGNAYFLIAALAWASLTLISTKSRQYTNAYTFTFYLFLFTTLLDMIVLNYKGMSINVTFTDAFIVNILLISVGATTFATTMYFVATSKLGGQKASSFVFLVPLNALIFSYFILGEQIKLNTIVGGLSAITAVYIINHKKRIR